MFVRAIFHLVEIVETNQERIPNDKEKEDKIVQLSKQNKELVEKLAEKLAEKQSKVVKTSEVDENRASKLTKVVSSKTRETENLLMRIRS